MTLTIRLKKRWIHSVLREAEKGPHSMPWHRGKRRKPNVQQLTVAPSSVGKTHA